MPSIISGYEYDIFISYRHKDNKGGHWVTEFVDALRIELEATFKEDISIYFDENPHDGLLENHNVDKSLEGKLKCLIFIPILSQTYCDPRSFAWQHEFCAFNKLAREDQFGRDVKLANGNVASRILPIKIHDLDADDKAHLENELGEILRPIEFIYRTPGVNRHLTAADNPEKNQNKTLYRDQINKVANSVKGIIHALTHPSSHESKSLTSHKTTKVVVPRKINLYASLGLVLFLGVGYFIYSKLNAKRDNANHKDRSIAVLPFVNISNDPGQEYFSDGLSEEVLNLLAKVPELKVIGRTSSFYFKGKNEDLRTIGEKLGVAYLLEGSVRKDGSRVKISAQLIESADGSRLWGETYDRQFESIFELQEEIAKEVLNQLKLKLLTSNPDQISTVNNPEVYNLMLQGNYYYDKYDLDKASEFFKQALALDSSNARIWSSLAVATMIQGLRSYPIYHANFALTREYTTRALLLDSLSSDAHRMMGNIKIFYDFDWSGAEREFNKAIRLNPSNSYAYRNLAYLNAIFDNHQGIEENIRKAIKLNPLDILNIYTLADSHVLRAEYEEAFRIIESGMAINPQVFHQQLAEIYLVWNKPKQAMRELEHLPADNVKTELSAMCYFSLGNEEKAKENLDTLLANPMVESYRVARVYAFMNQKEKAFKWLEKAVEEKYRVWSLKADPFLANLHGEPRYSGLLMRMNLPLE